MERARQERRRDQGLGKGEARPERIEAAPVEEQVRPREEVPEHGDHHPAEQAGIGVVGDQVGRVPRQRAGIDRHQDQAQKEHREVGPESHARQPSGRAAPARAP
jgi:hypothetical protein